MQLFDSVSNATAGIYMEYGSPTYASAQRFLWANGRSSKILNYSFQKKILNYMTETYKPPSHLER